MPPTGTRVRVVVVNYNGGEMTLDALRSLHATDWPEQDLELVLVDNASTDGIADRVGADLPRVRVIRSEKNLGFAGGNNLALRDLGGVSFVALVNPDALVAPGWLRPLVDALEHDNHLGAASPKILLADRYGEVAVPPPAAPDVALHAIRVGDDDVSGRVHIATGDNPFVASPTFPIPDAANLRIRVPLPTDAPISVALDLGLDAPVIVQPERSFDVVNNVGNVLLDGGYSADRGYLEQDAGQYDTPDDVSAWCGAAVVLRREYLEDVGHFDERLFLYFEDFELSWRGSDRGWRYRYVPESVVRHRHGAITRPGSRPWEYFNARNRLLVLTRHAPWPVLRRALMHQLAVTSTRAREDIADVASDGSSQSRPRFERLRRRARAFAGYLRYAPAMLVSRRRDRTRSRFEIGRNP